MPHIRHPYKPPFLLRNGHVHSVYPILFRRPPAIQWERERIRLPDTDFIDLDWYRIGSGRLIVLGHGLEGSTESTYIRAATKLFSEQGFDILAWNQRSCSGEMNDLPRSYHHGATEDLHAVLQHTLEYDEVHYVGYSLGGNVILKYMGERKFPIPSNFRSGVAISAPIDLPSSVLKIHRAINRIYHNRFLSALKQKVREKAKKVPMDISIEQLSEVRTLIGFDDFYTAPMHGFESADDYYVKASSRQFLKGIEHPALLLQSQDDPLLGDGCFPIEEANASDTFQFIETRYGGHIAFMQSHSRWHWMEDVALDFVRCHSRVTATL